MRFLLVTFDSTVRASLPVGVRFGFTSPPRLRQETGRTRAADGNDPSINRGCCVAWKSGLDRRSGVPARRRMSPPGRLAVPQPCVSSPRAPFAARSFLEQLAPDPPKLRAMPESVRETGADSLGGPPAPAQCSRCRVPRVPPRHDEGLVRETPPRWQIPARYTAGQKPGRPLRRDLAVLPVPPRPSRRYAPRWNAAKGDDPCSRNAFSQPQPRWR